MAATAMATMNTHQPTLILYAKSWSQVFITHQPIGIANNAEINTSFKKSTDSICTILLTLAQYSFLEDDNTLLYRTEKIRQQIINYASMLSILICCIGLFGLAHLSAGQRTKEIGVRKVLGASTLSIVKLFSKDVVRLVVFAALIAFPLSWIAMNNWLQDFAYRIPLSPWLFVAAGLIAVLIAMATVTFQAIRSAIANPVKSLRTE